MTGSVGGLPQAPQAVVDVGGARPSPSTGVEQVSGLVVGVVGRGLVGVGGADALGVDLAVADGGRELPAEVVGRIHALGLGLVRAAYERVELRLGERRGGVRPVRS